MMSKEQNKQYSYIRYSLEDSLTSIDVHCITRYKPIVGRELNFISNWMYLKHTIVLRTSFKLTASIYIQRTN